MPDKYHYGFDLGNGKDESCLTIFRDEEGDTQVVEAVLYGKQAEAVLACLRSRDEQHRGELFGARHAGILEGRKDVLDKVRVINKSILTHRDEIKHSEIDVLEYKRKSAAADIGLALLNNGLIQWDMEPFEDEFVRQILTLRVCELPDTTRASQLGSKEENGG